MKLASQLHMRAVQGIEALSRQSLLSRWSCWVTDFVASLVQVFGYAVLAVNELSKKDKPRWVKGGLYSLENGTN